MQEYLLFLSIIALSFIVWQDFFYKKPIHLPRILRQCLFILICVIYGILAFTFIYNTATEWCTLDTNDKLISILASIGWTSIFYRHLTQKTTLAKSLWK